MKDYDEFPVSHRIELDVVDWRGKGHRIAVDVTSHLRAFYEPLPLAASFTWGPPHVNELFGLEGGTYSPAFHLEDSEFGRKREEIRFRDLVLEVGGTFPLPAKHTLTGEPVQTVIQHAGWSIGTFGKKYRIDAAKERVAALQSNLRDRLVISDGTVMRRTPLPRYVVNPVHGEIKLSSSNPLDHDGYRFMIAQSKIAGLDQFEIDQLDAATRFAGRSCDPNRVRLTGTVLYFDPAFMPDGRRRLCADILSWCVKEGYAHSPDHHWRETVSAAKAACEGGDADEALSTIAGAMDDAIFEGVVEREGRIAAFLDRIVDAEGIRPYRPAPSFSP